LKPEIADSRSRHSHLIFTIHYWPKKEEHRGAPPFEVSSVFALLLGWRRRRRSADIDVNSRRAAAKQASSKNISRSQNHNHENNQHGNNACAATTISIVSHERPPPICRGIGLSELEGGWQDCYHKADQRSISQIPVK